MEPSGRPGLRFERFRHPIAFPELSNIPPLTRSCQDWNGEISLDSASCAGPAIANVKTAGFMVATLVPKARTLLVFRLR